MMKKIIFFGLIIFFNFQLSQAQHASYIDAVLQFAEDIKPGSDYDNQMASFTNIEDLKAALSHGKKLPEDESQHDEAVKKAYEALKKNFIDRKSKLASAFREAKVLLATANFQSVFIEKYEVIASNKRGRFSAPVPKEDRIHVVMYSLIVMARDAGNADNEIVFKLSCLENRGSFSIIEIDEYAMNFDDELSLHQNLPDKLVKILGQHQYGFSGLSGELIRTEKGDIDRDIYESKIQLSDAGKTILKHKGGFLSEYDVEAILMDNIPQNDVQSRIDEISVLLAASYRGDVSTFYMGQKKEFSLTYTLNSYTNYEFDKVNNQMVKYIYFDYETSEDVKKMALAQLILKRKPDGTGQIILVLRNK